MMTSGRLLEIAVSRTGVIALTSVGTLVVRTLSSIVLTRLLSPTAFGIVGVINAVFFALGMLTDLGFQSFVVRHERGDERHFLDVIWTIHATRGLVLMAVAAAGAPLAAWILDKPEVALPLAVVSVYFFLNGMTSLSLMTALRRDGARILSILDLGLQLFQTIVCIVVALWWPSAWAIIVGMIAHSVLRVILSYRLFADSAQRPARDRDIQREFLIFSRVVMVSSALALLISQSDKLVLARLLTLEQFGLYGIALNLASAPISFADGYISRVAFPIYTKTWRENPEALPYVYYACRQLPTRLFAFGGGLLLGGAGLLVAVLYDPRYQPAALFLSLLMVSSTLRLPNFAATEVMTATGQIKTTLRANVARLLWLAAMGTAGWLAFGEIGLIAAVGTIEVPAMLYNWTVLRRAGILDLRQELLYIALAAAGGAVGFFVADAVLTLFPRL